MTLQYSEEVRNAKLDAVETAVGTAPKLRIYTGSMPATTATAASGTLLAECSLPSDWMAAASAASKGISGTWEDTSANADGTAGYFRIYNTGATTCHIQGTVAAAAADMIVNNVVFATGQPFSVTAFTLTAGNA